MNRLLALVVILVAVYTTALGAGCMDITKVDFANRALRVAGIAQAAPPGESPFGGPAAEQIFHFHHGVSLEYERDKKPDRQTTIQQDVAVKPERSLTLRFMILFRNYLTGSGSWTYLVGLACSGGRVQQAFQSSGIFMRVAKISPEWVHVSMAVCKPSDLACCPSARKELRYHWDLKTRRYTLARPAPLSGSNDPASKKNYMQRAQRRIQLFIPLVASVLKVAVFMNNSDYGFGFFALPFPAPPTRS